MKIDSFPVPINTHGRDARVTMKLADPLSGLRLFLRSMSSAYGDWYLSSLLLCVSVSPQSLRESGLRIARRLESYSPSDANLVRASANLGSRAMALRYSTFARSLRCCSSWTLARL